MSKREEHKKHHYVPQTYLRQFAHSNGKQNNPTYFLNVYNRQASKSFPKNVEDVCQLPYFYKISDVFVFPSLREGLPVSVMEAMASGLPVIATRIRGSSDIVKDNVNGILLDPMDVDGFENAIIELCDNPNMRKQIAANNKEKSLEYDLPKILSEYRKIYGEGKNCE